MTLSPHDLQTLCLCGIAAANQAGQAILRASKLRHEVMKKIGGDTLASQIVTEVDLRSQQIILESLAGVTAQFDLGILAEESADNQSRFEKDAFWCIDPLDGTLPFTQGKPGYSVSIALVSHDGTPLIGIVHDPLEMTLYHAIRGQGAYRNGEPWKPMQDHPSKILTIIADQSFLVHPHKDDWLRNLRSQLGSFGCNDLQIHEQDGSVLNACMVLEKSPAIYCKFPKPALGGGSVWDYAATACIFTEAGASVLDMSGNTLNLNPVGSTYFNHCGVYMASLLTSCGGHGGDYKRSWG